MDQSVYRMITKENEPVMITPVSKLDISFHA